MQAPLSKLPEDVRRGGVTEKKRSSALVGVIALSSPKGTLDPLYISNYATINLLEFAAQHPRRRRRRALGGAGLRDAGLDRHRSADAALGLTTGDLISAIQSQNAQAAVGVAAQGGGDRRGAAAGSGR